MARSGPQDEGMDILKFFIAIMSFLTVLVAGMAGWNWSRAATLAEEVQFNLQDLDDLKRLCGSKEMQDLVAKDRASKDLVDVLNKDLGEFLNQTAATMNLSFSSFEKVGAGGFKQAGFEKFSYRFTIDKQPLKVVNDYLFYLQAKWPGLKIEEIAVSEAMRAKKEDPFPDWKTTVYVSIFKPKS